MIKANELRIGNWINYKGDPIPVTMVGQYGIQSKTDEILINAKFSTPDLSPIPLTPEILKQCGFERSGHNWKIKDQYFLEVQEHGGWVNGEPVSEIKYMVYKSAIGAIKEVKYLHKLQNLYYEVMDSELQITFKELTPH